MIDDDDWSEQPVRGSRPQASRPPAGEGQCRLGIAFQPPIHAEPQIAFGMPICRPDRSLRLDIGVSGLISEERRPGAGRRKVRCSPTHGMYFGVHAYGSGRFAVAGDVSHSAYVEEMFRRRSKAFRAAGHPHVRGTVGFLAGHALQ
jgi:hypothetical protein